MQVSLSGQVVVIVGASSGTGRAAAMLFAREGANVVAGARREDRLQSLKDELAKEQRDITVRRADASSVEDMQHLAQLALEKFGRIDILVFASGTNTKERAMERLTPEIWNSLIDTNLNGAFYATHAILPSMRKAGAGHLIYISSISGLLADVSGAAYQASKRGVVALAHAIRMEEKQNGIQNMRHLSWSHQYGIAGQEAGEAIPRSAGEGFAGRRCCRGNFICREITRPRFCT